MREWVESVRISEGDGGGSTESVGEDFEKIRYLGAKREICCAAVADCAR